MHEYYLNFVPHSLNFIYHPTAQDMKLEMKIKKMFSYTMYLRESAGLSIVYNFPADDVDKFLR